MCEKKDINFNTIFAPADEETRKRLSKVVADDALAKKLAETFIDEIENDDETLEKVGYHMAQAILENNAEALLIAVCGWSSKSLLNIMEHGVAYPSEEVTK